MNREGLDKLCEAPVHLIADLDGMVIGNHQFLALRLRDLTERFDEWLKRPSLAVRPITKADLKNLLEKVFEC